MKRIANICASYLNVEMHFNAFSQPFIGCYRCWVYAIGRFSNLFPLPRRLSTSISSYTVLYVEYPTPRSCPVLKYPSFVIPFSMNPSLMVLNASKSEPLCRSSQHAELAVVLQWVCLYISTIFLPGLFSLFYHRNTVIQLKSHMRDLPPLPPQSPLLKIEPKPGRPLLENTMISLSDPSDFLGAIVFYGWWDSCAVTVCRCQTCH
jgi:hypothetical protein